MQFLALLAPFLSLVMHIQHPQHFLRVIFAKQDALS